jgi:hypothetical protein
MEQKRGKAKIDGAIEQERNSPLSKEIPELDCKNWIQIRIGQDKQSLAMKSGGARYGHYLRRHSLMKPERKLQRYPYA